jgi:hypothetical protein
MTSPVTLPICTAIAHPDAVFPDEEEITDDGDEHALHGYCDAGREEAGKRGERPQLRGEGEADNGHDQRPENDSAHQQQLMASPRLLHVAKHSASPRFRGYEHDCQQCQQYREAHSQRFQCVEY